MLNGHYQPSLVLLSILVAMFASYTTLSLAMRVKESHGHAPHAWMLGGALAMGTGIWAMHFIGMLAFRLPLPVGYDPAITFVSWLLPVVVSGLALWQVRHREIGGRHLAWSALLMGLGINAMHYTGMAGMRMDPPITYDPWLFLASVAIAIGASAGALWIAFRLNETVRHQGLVQLGAAIVMGSAIAGMHYTGMAAAHFNAASVCRAAIDGVNQDHLAILVAVASFAVLSIALMAAIFDSRLASRNRTLAASLETAAERQALYLREQEARVEAEHLSQLKDEFLATLSHELRTPLNAMLGWSQLLLAGVRDEAMLRRGLETIERNARAQSQLIEDMLDMSRLITGKVRVEARLVTPAEFVNAALETARPAAIGKQIQLSAEVDYDAGPAMGDPAFLPYVFDRFRQADASSSRRHGGLGLGLAIARQLVELQGGTITVSSAGAGRGATFTISLPIHQGAAPAEPAPAPLPVPVPVPVNGVAGAGAQPEAGSLAGLLILVVDDEIDSLELVQQVLADSGARILTAGGANEAVRLLEQHRPDLLISDIGMPMLDGFALIGRVRALRDKALAGIPAIALTAFSRREDQQRALEAGFDEYMAKPLRPVVLVQTVVGVVERRALMRA